MADQAFAFQIADLIQVGLLRVDHWRVIRECNEAGRQLLAPHVRELVGRTVLETFLDHRVIEMVDDALVSGTAHREITFGADPPRSLLLHAIRNPAGAWIVIRDLSELRRLQRIRTEFVDNLAHELRAPLTNVRLLAETLAMDAEDAQLSPRVRDSISRIEAETDHLSAMVNELLDLARIEQADVPILREPVDLADVVNSVSKRLQPFADRQGLRVISQLPPSVDQRTVGGDAERLEQSAVQPRSTTPSSSRRRTARLSFVSSRQTTERRSRSRSKTTGRAFPSATSTASSSASTRSTERELAPVRAAPAWAWRSPATSPRPTAAASGSRARKARARPSTCRCRAPRLGSAHPAERLRGDEHAKTEHDRVANSRRRQADTVTRAMAKSGADGREQALPRQRGGEHGKHKAARSGGPPRLGMPTTSAAK